MYRTFGEPSGADGCVYGSQSGLESLMSMLIVPLNGLRMVVLSNRCGARAGAGATLGRRRYECGRRATSPRRDERPGRSPVHGVDVTTRTLMAAGVAAGIALAVSGCGGGGGENAAAVSTRVQSITRSATRTVPSSTVPSSTVPS